MGLSCEGLRQLRSLIEQRGRNAWDVGDLLHHVYGPPARQGHDGSTARLQALAELFGCSWSWLSACRATSAAWRLRDRRPSVCWAVHRHLVARPDRVSILDEFVRHCSRAKVVPSQKLLVAYLDDHVGRSAFGRPRADPVLAIERRALALDRPALERLVERLAAALRTPAAA